MNLKGVFMSESQEWETPKDLFDQLDQEFRFDLDAAASEENAKCERFFTKDQDGLKQKWEGTVWCNPPYGKKATREWTRKAWEEFSGGATIVMLLPVRTDTRWFHEYVYGKAEIRFIRGRLRFGNAEQPAPFPSMIAIYRREKK